MNRKSHLFALLAATVEVMKKHNKEECYFIDCPIDEFYTNQLTFSIAAYLNPSKREIYAKSNEKRIDTYHAEARAASNS